MWSGKETGSALYMRQGSHRWMSLIVPAAVLIGGILGTPCLAQPPTSGDSPASRIFKLYVNESGPKGAGKQDTAWRYFSEQGSFAYRNRDYVAAERFYEAALSDAEQKQINDGNKILILSNLAAAKREQGKLGQSEKLIGRALTECDQLSEKKPSLYGYVLQQYAGLLKKLGREDEAQFALEAARSGARLLPATAPPVALTGCVRSDRLFQAAHMAQPQFAPSAGSNGLLQASQFAQPQLQPLSPVPGWDGPPMYPGFASEGYGEGSGIILVRMIGIGMFNGGVPHIIGDIGASYQTCHPCLTGPFGSRW